MLGQSVAKYERIVLFNGSSLSNGSTSLYNLLPMHLLLSTIIIFLRATMSHIDDFLAKDA